jgi:hypothetical protein
MYFCHIKVLFWLTDCPQMFRVPIWIILCLLLYKCYGNAGFMDHWFWFAMSLGNTPWSMVWSRCTESQNCQTVPYGWQLVFHTQKTDFKMRNGALLSFSYFFIAFLYLSTLYFCSTLVHRRVLAAADCIEMSCFRGLLMSNKAITSLLRPFALIVEYSLFQKVLYWYW